MPLEFINLNSPPVVAVNCDNGKAMGKEKWHMTSLGGSTKNNKDGNNDKMEIKFEINKELKYK